MQIRVRLTLQFILITAGILSIAFFYIHFQFKRNLLDEYYESLQSKSLIIAEMAVGNKTDEKEFRKQPAHEDYGTLIVDYPENISIYTWEGRRIYTFNPTPDDIQPGALIEVKENGSYRFVHRKYNALGVTYTNKLGQNFIVVAESVFDQVHVNNLLRILIIVFVTGISFIAIVGWIFARQALAPVSEIMNQVDALLPTDMSQRLQTKNQHDELSRLVITFNKLLDRIQHVFRNQKMFLSNLSHELKNPLSVIVSQVEVTLDKDRENDEYRSTLQSVLSDVKELNEVSERLMQLARVSSNDSAIEFQPLRIDELIWQSKASLVRTHPGYKIDFEIISLPDREEDLIINGNDQLLRTALTNLMDNGCKFSPDKYVRVSLMHTADQINQLAIADHGPGIAKEDLPHIFDPFYRSAKTSNVRGSGIGLSLVSTILQMHHISTEVHSEQGKGTTFVLRFPISDTSISHS